MLVVDTMGSETKSLGGLTLSPLEAETTTSKFDLTLNVVESVDATGCPQIDLGWEYSTDLYEPETIERLSENFIQLVGDIISKPNQAMETLSLVSPKYHRLLEKGQGRKLGQSLNVCSKEIERQVEHSPEATALVFCGQSITYDEMNKRANKLAHYLIKQGVDPDVLVGMCLSVLLR